MSSTIELSQHEVALPGLPDDLNGIRIVHLTDFHIGCGDSASRSAEAVELANEVSAELILLSGDYVNRKPIEIPAAEEILCRLRAGCGIFATLGNHDYYADAKEMVSALGRVGITVLDNQSVEALPGLWISGLDDLHMGHGDVDKALKNVPTGAATVLLSHNPNALRLVAKDRPVIILSGHTHGAQIVLPFPTPQMICRWHLGTGYVNGWYRRGKARMYVSRGIGVTGVSPLNRRFRCPPEVAVFVLRAA